MILFKDLNTVVAHLQKSQNCKRYVAILLLDTLEKQGHALALPGGAYVYTDVLPHRASNRK